MYFINLFNKPIKPTNSTKSGSAAVKIEIQIKIDKFSM